MVHWVCKSKHFFFQSRWDWFIKLNLWLFSSLKKRGLLVALDMMPFWRGGDGTLRARSGRNANPSLARRTSLRDLKPQTSSLPTAVSSLRGQASFVLPERGPSEGKGHLALENDGGVGQGMRQHTRGIDAKRLPHHGLTVAPMVHSGDLVCFRRERKIVIGRDENIFIRRRISMGTSAARVKTRLQPIRWSGETERRNGGAVTIARTVSYRTKSYARMYSIGTGSQYI